MCSESVVCRTSSVKRHYESNHKWLLDKSEDEQKEYISRQVKNANLQYGSFVKFVKSTSNLVSASFEVSKIIARHGKPFSDGDYIKESWLECAPYLFKDLQNKDKILQRIKDLPVSRNTVKVRIINLNSNIENQLKEDFKLCQAFSICLDESTDVTSPARLAIILDIRKTTNFITAHALNKRKLELLLNEVQSVYSGLLMYNSVRWLSRGRVLERFIECLDEIRMFMDDNKQNYSELTDVDWLSRLMFFTDFTLHLNELNTKLQGFGKTVDEAFDIITAFEKKLKIFSNVIWKNESFNIFKELKSFILKLKSMKLLSKKLKFCYFYRQSTQPSNNFQCVLCSLESLKIQQNS